MPFKVLTNDYRPPVAALAAADLPIPPTGAPAHRGRRKQELREELAAAVARADQAEEALKRAVYLGEHLWQMVPQEVWRAHGGDDGQGHYEGDYHAEQVREELAALARSSSPGEEAAGG